MRDRRSLLNFAVLIVVASTTAVFVVNKANEAIAEIHTLQSTPAYLGRKALAAEAGEIDTAPVPSGIEGWKTYRNEKYRFEMRHPNNYDARLLTSPGGQIVMVRSLETQNIIGWSVTESRFGDIEIIPRASEAELADWLGLQRPIEANDRYFTSSKLNPYGVEHNTYWGVIDIGEQQGHQILHTEFGSQKYSIFRNEDNTWLVIRGWFDPKIREAFLSKLEPYDSILVTFKFIQ